MALADVRLVVFDFDGVFTDNRVWTSESGAESVAYLGNDINDAACLGAVGLPVVPADAWPEVVPLARLVLSRAGGHGCVRELCDAIWNACRAEVAA